ncbi:MAG: hypothetical protein A2V99_10615 [Spirochaetes bacterium RBG_16_67_19]|nr:MAG: hypothetical protein A2V99_10615 [Spirochaetes bacterium RBG_16_67_19]
MLVRAAIAIALMLSAGTVSLPAKGKTEQADVPRDYSNGLAAGQRDARDCGIAVLSGFRLGKRNLILPWVIGTEMPGGDLVGKSAEYVGGYVEEYRNKAKPKRFLYSLAGAEVEPPANTGKDTKDSCSDCGCCSSGGEFDEEVCLGCAGLGLGAGCEILEGLGEVASGVGSAMNSCQ